MIRNFISKLYSLYTPSFFISGGGSAAGGYLIERSLRFNAASSQYLSKTYSASGTTVTFSFWVKRGALGTAQSIFGWTNTVDTAFRIRFNPSNQLSFDIVSSTVQAGLLTTTRVFRDPSAWYHVVCVLDTTNATATDRMRMYVNGVRETSFASSVNPSLNYVSPLAVSQTWQIGAQTNQGEYLDGYLAEFFVVNTQALNQSSFGEISTATGQWVAKKYTGTYGTNGFYLDFKDGTSTTTLGQDKSGNTNNWTLTNFTRSAGVNDCWMRDVPAGNGSASAVQPSGNYATLNPLIYDSLPNVPSKGNLTAFLGNGSNGRLNWSTVGMTTGVWYAEFTIDSISTNSQFCGIIPESSVNSVRNSGNTNVGDKANEYGYGRVGSNASKYINISLTSTGTTLPVAGDVVGLKFDADNRTLEITLNGVAQSITGFTSIPAGTYYFAVSAANYQWSINCGQRSFAYTPPTGFKALCTANLPTPSIKKPSDHFNVQLSTGANIKTNSEALFTNELEWIKDRANANNHQLIDSVRGTNAVLQSNTTAAETTYTAPSGSSVGWVWRASGSAAVTNTNGSISSQVSANVAAGFSVVTYTGTGANATVGHGLGVAPKMVIVKQRSSPVASWVVWHSNLLGTQYLNLELTNGVATLANVWNSTIPSSSSFSLGTNSVVNSNSLQYVAYCFAEIAGYSKFGSYTGNGSADGTNVTLGFKPAFVMIKRTDTTSNWTMFDNQRDGYNVDNDQLYANTTGAEVTTDLMDLLSNGFKSRSSDASINANGGTYIYMAFAETPFAYSNAR